MQKDSMGQNTRKVIEFLLLGFLIPPLASQFMTSRLVYQTYVSTRYCKHPNSCYSQRRTQMGPLYLILNQIFK